MVNLRDITSHIKKKTEEDLFNRHVKIKIIFITLILFLVYTNVDNLL